MIWDYRCPRCGKAQEREVPVAMRDLQTCLCGGAMERLQAFVSQHTVIPLHMKSGHDERTYIPAEPAAREKFLADAYRQHGRWRSDLEARSRSDVMADVREAVPETRKTVPSTRQIVEEAFRETKARFGGRTA